MRRWLGLFIGCALSVWCLSAVAARAAPATDGRIALVIGNAAYAAGPLPTAANDAGLVAQALAQAGFDVTAAADTDSATLRKTVQEFEETAKRAGPEASVLVYLSGYGVQFDGDDFFAPVDASIAHADEVPGETLRLSDLSRAIEATQAGTRIFIFDLARANPFVKGDAMPLAAGLSFVSAIRGSLYGFNAAPGMVAGTDAPPYGVFARALAEMIQEPGLPMQALFDRLRLRVGELTDGAVVPWDASNIESGFTFYPAAGAAPPATAAPIEAVPIAALSADVAYSAVVARDSLSGYQDFMRTFPRDALAARVNGLLSARREALTWTEAFQADDPRAFWTYMRRYPRGPHVYDARRVLAALHAPLEPPPRFEIYDFADLPPPPPSEIAFLMRPDATFPDPEWAPIPPPPGAFLPSPRAAFYDELPPPLPAPADILPIAAPLPVTDSAGRNLPVAEGRIMQVRGAGAERITTKMVVAADGGSTLTLTGGAPPRMISRATTTVGPPGDRSILQAGPKNEILSRTTTVHVAGALTTLQTGATGGLIMKIVGRAEPSGGRAFEVTNSRSELVANLRRDSQGIVVKRDIVGARDKLSTAGPVTRGDGKRPAAETAPDESARPMAPPNRVARPQEGPAPAATSRPSRVSPPSSVAGRQRDDLPLGAETRDPAAKKTASGVTSPSAASATTPAARPAMSPRGAGRERSEQETVGRPIPGLRPESVVPTLGGAPATSTNAPLPPHRPKAPTRKPPEPKGLSRKPPELKPPPRKRPQLAAPKRPNAPRAVQPAAARAANRGAPKR